MLIRKVQTLCNLRYAHARISKIKLRDLEFSVRIVFVRSAAVLRFKLPYHVIGRIVQFFRDLFDRYRALDAGVEKRF